jgi:hypothetical protein
MEGIYDAALQKAPMAVNGSGVNIAANSLFGFMVDPLMIVVPDAASSGVVEV